MQSDSVPDFIARLDSARPQKPKEVVPKPLKPLPLTNAKHLLALGRYSDFLFEASCLVPGELGRLLAEAAEKLPDYLESVTEEKAESIAEEKIKEAEKEINKELREELAEKLDELKREVES